MKVEPEIFKKHRGWFLFLGILWIILGTAAIVLPGLATLTVEMIFGYIFIVGGVFRVIHSFWAKKWGGFLWEVITGLVYLAVGILFLTYQLQGVLTLTLLLIIFFAVEGILRIILSIQKRTLPYWGWSLVSGLLALILAVMIAVGFPSTAVWALGLLVGINLLFEGWAMLLASLAARKV